MVEINANKGLQVTNKSVKLGTLASDPGTPVEGELWYNSTDNKLRIYDGVSSVNVGDIAPALVIVGQNTVRQALDRSIFLGSGVFVESALNNGGSISFADTDATLVVDKYLTTASATSLITMVIPPGTFSATASSAFGTALVYQTEGDASVKYKLINAPVDAVIPTTASLDFQAQISQVFTSSLMGQNFIIAAQAQI